MAPSIALEYFGTIQDFHSSRHDFAKTVLIFDYNLQEFVNVRKDSYNNSHDFDNARQDVVVIWYYFPRL